MEAKRVLSPEENKKIINFTLDNLVLGATKGLFLFGFSYMLFKRKTISLFLLGYPIGMSLSHSNDYLNDVLSKH